MPKTKTVLMCPPDHFDIEYEINAWMHLDNQVKPPLAKKQWQQLYDTYHHKLGWQVELINPQDGLPDMVFSTDNALVLDGKVMLSYFCYPQRRPETGKYQHWFLDKGYKQVVKPKHKLEGGDILIFGDKIIAGYGYRTELEAHRELAEYFGREVVSMRIVDPFFYHLKQPGRYPGDKKTDQRCAYSLLHGQNIRLVHGGPRARSGNRNRRLSYHRKSEYHPLRVC